MRDQGEALEVWVRREAWAPLRRSGLPKDLHTHRENHWDLHSHRENHQVHRPLREEVYKDFLPPRRPHPHGEGRAACRGPGPEGPQEGAESSSDRTPIAPEVWGGSGVPAEPVVRSVDPPPLISTPSGAGQQETRAGQGQGIPVDPRLHQGAHGLSLIHI